MKKRRYRAKCKHFDPKTLCCDIVRKYRKGRAIVLSCECTMRGDCGYEEREEKQNGGAP